MPQKINIDSTREELDSLLKEKYGYGIWEFELSLVQTYITYFYGKGKKIENIANERIRQLYDLKDKLLILIDNFLSNIDFYKNSIRIKSIKDMTGVSTWTTENRKTFIKNNYRFTDLFIIIDRQIRYYQALDFKFEIESSLWGVESLLRLKPTNFLILIWSYAMKRGTQVDWINMERLLNWYSNKVYEKALSEFYNFDKECTYPPEILRLTRNKYKDSIYDELAEYLFRNFFKGAKEEIKNEYPKIVTNLKKIFIGEKDIKIEDLQGFHDLFACLSALYPDYFPEINEFGI